MAIYRCNIHPSRASAMDHSRYIAREGRYLELAQKRGETICHGVGNMPEWANAEASRFWEAAEKHERANANHYREFEVALPRELSHEQMEATVKGFSQEQFGERHAYQYALHLNANNPHAHIMFSEKMNDGLARGEEQYFKRYNPKKPERGGCKKSNEWEAQRGNKASERLLQAREAWANHVNRALERAGHEARVDHRSYEARGIDQIPQPKVGPKVWHQPNREQHPRFQEFEAVRLANQAPQVRANLTAIEVNLGAAERELAEITAAIREMEARELKARQQEAAAARARAQAPQKPQNAPGANLEPRVREKAPEVQKSENSPSVAPVRPAPAVEAPKPVRQAQEAPGFARLKAVVEARDALYQRRAEAYSASAELNALREMPSPKRIQGRIEQEKKYLQHFEDNRPKKKGLLWTKNKKEIDDHDKIIAEKKKDIEQLETQFDKAMKQEPARQAKMQALEEKTYSNIAGELMKEMNKNKEDLIKAFAACVSSHGQEATEAFMLKACAPKHLELAKSGLAALQRQVHQRARGRGQDRGGGYGR